jgi:hypothetical protein
VLCLALGAGTSALAAPRVDVVSADLGPLIDHAAQSPSRFAVDVPHAISPSTDGDWSASGSTSTWTYAVQIPGAVSMSFHATRASLPASATLTVTANGTQYVYTSKDANGGELWSRIGRGDSLIFELSVATADADAVQLEIASLQAGYRAFGAGMRNHPHYDDLRAHALAATEVLPSCADNWSCEITPTNEGPGNATVALVIGNVGQCSGVLLNDVPGDGAPYVLTARHCENGDSDGGDPGAAANITAYWNAVSACGATLGTIYDSDAVTQYGAQTVVEQQDAWLVRLQQPPAVDTYYAGWDATGAAFIGGFTAHHAMGSARQYIGWFGQAAYFTVPAAELGVHYDSTFWGTVNAVGAGGPGASGAGVFDSSGRLVGTLVRGIEQGGTGVCPATPRPVPSESTATTFATALSGIFSSTADPVSSTGAVTLESVLDPQHTSTKSIDGRNSPIKVTFDPLIGIAESGQQMPLSWHASVTAKTCTASGGEPGDGWAGPAPTSGSKTVVSFDGGDITYTLTCTDGQRTGTGSVTAHWNLSPPQVQLFGGGAVAYGDQLSLSWTSNVRPCAATGGMPGDGWSGALTPNGVQMYTPVTETVVGNVTYTLTCGTGTRIASAQTTVTINPPQVGISADAVTLLTGQYATINSSTSGHPCAKSGGSAGDGWAGSVDGSISITESTPGAYTYAITCGSGSHVATGQVTVTFVNTGPAISLRASAPNGSVALDTVVLSWDANVRPCQLSASGPTGPRPAVGPLSPSAMFDEQELVIGPYDYTVSCGAGANAVQGTVTVDWTGTPGASVNGPDGAVRGSTFTVEYSSNVVPCTASGGEPGDNWTGQFQDGYRYISVTEQTVGTKTYTITCGSGAQTVTASASVNVISNAPQVTLTADKSAQVVAVPVTLTWSSNVSPCVLSGGSPGDGWSGSFGSSGSVAVTETSAYSYFFTIWCGTGSLKASASTFVTFANALPPMLSASKTEALVGETFTLTWASTDGSTCATTGGNGSDGWQGNLPSSGSLDVRESYTGTMTFGLVCGGSLPATVYVKIDPAATGPDPSLPPTVQLAASTGSAKVGEDFTLTWTVSNAQSCTASAGAANDGWTGALAANGGSMTIREAMVAQYTYDITCFGANGTMSAAVAAVSVYQPTSDGASSSSGGGGGGSMGPIDVAFFSALALCGFLRRRRVAAQRSAVV